LCVSRHHSRNESRKEKKACLDIADHQIPPRGCTCDRHNAHKNPAADYDPSDTEPYLLLQRQFEDDDRGLCYLETRDIDRFAGHYRLRLIEFTRTRLAFEIDRPDDRTAGVTYKLSTRRFRQVQRIVHIIFGVEP